MFAAKVALISTFVVSSLAIPSVIGGHKHRSVPAQFKRGYAQDADLLEPYEDYHSRYMEFECENHHGTPFFDLCCHPQLKENASNDFDDSCYQYCEEDDEPVSSAPAPAATTSAARVESSAPPANVEQPESSTFVAPKPTTTKAPAPAPTTKKAAPKPTSSSAPSSGGESWNSGGQATFFYQGGNPGACGNYHSDSDKIIAIDHIRYGSDSERSSTCGRQIEIVNTDNGRSVVATVADDCPSCTGKTEMNSLDLSIGAFTALGDESQGVLPIKWRFIS